MLVLLITFFVGLFSDPSDLYDICMAIRSQCKKIVQDSVQGGEDVKSEVPASKESDPVKNDDSDDDEDD